MSAETQATFHRESLRISFLLQKFREDLANRTRIYIYKSNIGLTHLDILRLKAALDLYGPQRLLCVVPSNSEIRHGEVAGIASGLKLAALDRMAPYDNQEDADFQGWLAICNAAIDDDWDQDAHAPASDGFAAPVGPVQLGFAGEDVVLDNTDVANSVYRTLYRTLLLREADGVGLAANVADAVSNRRTLEYAINRILVSEEYEEKFRLGRPTS